VQLDVARRRLWLDAGRGTAGAYLLDPPAANDLAALPLAPAGGRSSQALLHVRKWIAGRRITRLRRIAGERTLVVDAGNAALCLRLSGPAPALTLAVDGVALATLGDGPAAWPPAPDAPETEWPYLRPERLAEILAAARRGGRTPRRALMAAFPTLGPLLCGWLAEDPERLAELRAALGTPVPCLIAPKPLADCTDADLAPPDAVAVAPLPLDLPGRRVVIAVSWSEAAASFLRARRRGDAFEQCRRQALESCRRELRRLTQLHGHLVRDQARLPAADAARHKAGALLAALQSVPPGAAMVELDDPYDPGTRVVVDLDPRLGAAANADRLFDQARRAQRGRLRIETRIAETRARLAAGLASESRILAASRLAEVEGSEPESRARVDTDARGPRHYLTTRGLSLLAGRGARENHRLTFGVARADDLWLHARDVAGAHVILRDGEGRAGPEDLREAAEVAAFFSDARSQAQVDVHVTRRKHVRPASGGPGRVRVSHSDTLRVSPRDPEGRLRRR
jgi:hypothetical protein